MSLAPPDLTLVLYETSSPDDDSMELEVHVSVLQAHAEMFRPGQPFALSPGRTRLGFRNTRMIPKFKAFVGYCYHGRLPKTVDHIVGMMQVAYMFGAKNCMSQCAIRLKAQPFENGISAPLGVCQKIMKNADAHLCGMEARFGEFEPEERRRRIREHALATGEETQMLLNMRSLECDMAIFAMLFPNTFESTMAERLKRINALYGLVE